MSELKKLFDAAADPIDPFEEPLEPQQSDRLILNDTYFEAARSAITVDGMAYSFLKPPYMNQTETKRSIYATRIPSLIWLFRLRQDYYSDTVYREIYQLHFHDPGL